MKSHPILFSAPMVRAILDGSKTQTRRVVKNTPSLSEHIFYDDESNQWGFLGYSLDHNGDPTVEHWNECKCPYGQVGDQLWVREEHYSFGHWEEVKGVRTKTGKQKRKFVADSEKVLFDGDSLATVPDGKYRSDCCYTKEWHKRLARFMPRKFSRITLEITEIRVERLQDISNDDAEAEGIFNSSGMHDFDCDGAGFGPDQICRCGDNSPSETYRRLWESINGLNTWTQNPFVWVITFKRIS